MAKRPRNPFPGQKPFTLRPPRAKKRSTRTKTGRTLVARSREIPSHEKALYHDVLGAGRRRTVRPFFGLTDQDQTDVRDFVATHLEGVVAAFNRTGRTAGIGLRVRRG